MMQVQRVSFDKTGFFSGLFLDYINQKESLKSFYDLYPTVENLLAKAGTITFPEDKRKVLHDVLQQQYGNIAQSPLLKENISALLQKNTYTVTTGHQLNLFTGPLYFILKIAAVIDTCRRLNERQKERKFIPVYWMASEDHDFEEINHFYLFNKKFVWETAQTGAVGEFSTEGIEKIFSEIKDKIPMLEKAYLEQPTLAAATRYLVNELFGAYGLVILDPDNASLKHFFSPVVKDELMNGTSFRLVNETSGQLKNAGYPVQVNPRELNLFFKSPGSRERIVKTEDGFQVLNTSFNFGSAEMEEKVTQAPAHFSPNVVLRPLYQQIILPNVAYCGGPSELAYWFQLKGLFDNYSIPFPILLPRTFAMIVNKTFAGRMNKLGLSAEDLFLEEKVLKEKCMSGVASASYDLEAETKDFEQAFDKVRSKAKTIDPTLEPYVEGEKQKFLKVLEQMEKRLKKAEEQKHETLLSQLSNLKSRLFPEGNLQERRDNFFNFYLQDQAFIGKVLDMADPFDFRFNVIIENPVE